MLVLTACNGSKAGNSKASSDANLPTNTAQASSGKSSPEAARKELASKEAGTATLPPPLFVQTQVEALATFRYENGQDAGNSSILESLGGGVGAWDFDNDGMLDLVMPGGGGFSAPETITGLPTRLLRSTGALQFEDVSRQARIDPVLAYTHGVAIADVDNDGFRDCLVTGYGRLQLFHNLGDGTFIELAHSAGLNDTRWSSSAAWCDINCDGNLDLYCCHYVNWSFANNPYCPGPDPEHREICSPRDFEAVDHVLYLSQGDGQFVDVSEKWGLAKGGKGLGVVTGDMDGDRLPDIYVANDTTENFLYRNRGDHFEEVGQAAVWPMTMKEFPTAAWELIWLTTMAT